MNKRIIAGIAGVLAAVTLTGCSGIPNVSTAPTTAESLATNITQTAKFDKKVTVKTCGINGNKESKITVSVPEKVLAVAGNNLPTDQTASWYVFNIEGLKTEDLSDAYVADPYGTYLKMSQDNNSYYGRVYDLGNGKYGVMIPNGYSGVQINSDGSTSFKADVMGIRIGNTLFIN